MRDRQAAMGAKVKPVRNYVAAKSLASAFAGPVIDLPPKVGSDRAMDTFEQAILDFLRQCVEECKTHSVQ